MPDDPLAVLVNPRPWALAYRDRGLGHGDYGVMDANGVLVVGSLDPEIAELIVTAVNALGAGNGQD